MGILHIYLFVKIIIPLYADNRQPSIECLPSNQAIIFSVLPAPQPNADNQEIITFNMLSLNSDYLLSARIGVLRPYITGTCVALIFTVTGLGQLQAATESALLLQLQTSALRGDLRPVEQLIESLDEATLDELSLTLLHQYQARFSGLAEVRRPISEIPMANQTIAIYQDYWRSALTHSLSPDEAEQYLQIELRELLRKDYPAYQPGNDVFFQLQQALAVQSLGSSLADTPPWRDLYIWSRHHNRIFEVELTDMVEEVEVTMIDQPLVQGWQHFASLDLTATSGWATASGLYCLCWSYDLDSEAFRVNWLKHETRHLVDFREFPGLPEAAMEYRAKLTELAFAGNQVSSLLRHFANNGSDDSPSAHAVANYRVSHNIYHEIFQQEMPQHLDPWQLLGPDRVGPAAFRLLQRDTAKLREQAVALAP